jgi:aarF domain-containing kinase
VEAAFGKSLEELFDRFDPKPLASGSIAQVHRATLRRHAAGTAAGSSGAAAAADEDEVTEVVVKVCHPNVHRHICLDFRLLARLSAAAARVPALRGLSLRESVAQFSHTMTAQTDLRVEAVHALRFSNNFSGAVAAASSSSFLSSSCYLLWWHNLNQRQQQQQHLVVHVTHERGAAAGWASF